MKIESRTDYQEDLLCSQSYSIISEVGGPNQKRSGRVKAAESYTTCWYRRAKLMGIPK